MAARISDQHENRRAREGYEATSLPIDTALDVFARALASGKKRVAISRTDFVQYMLAVRVQVAAGLSDARRPADASADTEQSATLAHEGASGNGVERRLAAIYRELLGVDRVGGDDDFFALGGHSLLATRVLARIEATLGVRLTLRDVFDAPTINRLTEKVDAARAAAVAANAAEDREELEF